MTDDARRAADALLDRALDLAPDERSAFVDTHVPDELSAYLRVLLAAAEGRDPLLDASPVTVGEFQDAIEDDEAADGAVGEAVGPYRIVGLLGEGGMGRVYRAERADGAFDRDVALKLVRRSLMLAGLDVSSRLRRERAVLATLEHPNIARLYDGGETEDGVPWVAMELVDGQPITAYADRRGLVTRARVALFVDVCRAVEHAHRRLVVHRDLKPTNVFVAEDEDGGAQVKLLDFGIARLLDVEAVGLTQTAGAPYTPGYAAPEQVRGGDVTTATDVWALGAVLYELLSGRRAYGLGPVTGPAGRLHALERSLREAPPPPSGVASGPTAVDLRGDLDAVVLQALHPDPDQRYASAGALADDLGRHLEGQPVLARPASGWYHTQVFVRRHRSAVGAAVAVVAALAVGLAVSLLSLGREQEARAAAEAEVARADAAFTFVVDLFGGSDGAPLALDPRTEALLEAGERRAGRLTDDAQRAVAFRALSDVFSRVGAHEASLRTSSQALRAARATYGPGHPHTLSGAREHTLVLLNTLELDRAHRLFRQTVDGYRALGDAGARTLRRFLSTYGAMLAVNGQHVEGSNEWLDTSVGVLDEAEPLARTARDSVALLEVLGGRAHVAQVRHGLAAALPIHREVSRLAREVHGDTYSALLLHYNYALVAGDAGAVDEAFAANDLVVRIARESLGPDHPAFPLVLSRASNLRLQRGARGDLAEALALTAEADRPDAQPSPSTLLAASDRLTALRAASRWRELLDRARGAFALYDAADDDLYVAWSEAQVTFARLGLGDRPGARSLAESLIGRGGPETTALAHIVLACLDGAAAGARWPAVRDAALDSLAAYEYPMHGLTARLLRAGPAGGACDGWVPEA